MKLLLTILMLAVMPASFTGCTTTQRPPATIAYLTLRDTWTGVKTAMRIYADECARDKVPLDKQIAIDNAYEKFRMAFLAALRTASFKWDAATDAEIDALAQQVLALIRKI